MFELILPTNKMPPKTPLNQTDPIRTKKRQNFCSSAGRQSKQFKVHLPECPAQKPHHCWQNSKLYRTWIYILFATNNFRPFSRDPCSASRFVHGGWNTSRLLYGVVWQQQLPRSKDPQHVNHAAWSSASHFFFVHAGHRGIREF